jgi:hypothetical protein
MAHSFFYNGETFISMVFLYSSYATPGYLNLDNTIITLAIYSKSGTYVCSSNIRIMNSNTMAPFATKEWVSIDLVSNALVKEEQYVAVVLDRWFSQTTNGITYPGPDYIDFRSVEIFLNY